MKLGLPYPHPNNSSIWVRLKKHPHTTKNFDNLRAKTGLRQDGTPARKMTSCGSALILNMGWLNHRDLRPHARSSASHGNGRKMPKPIRLGMTPVV
jgi:hypothetical protein